MNSRHNQWYNNKIGELIDDIPISTNVLEHYDNVTYNIGIYVVPINVQRELDKIMYENINHNINIHTKKKIVIAQTGVTSKFSVNGLRLKNVFGPNSNETCIMTCSANIKLYESMGCNFANELSFITKFCGYDSYFQRPIWLEIWFSGYDQTNGTPIERIPLPNGNDSVVLCGHMATVKSNVTHLGTEWDIEFIPTYKSLINDNFNYLSIEGIIKSNEGMSLNDFMKIHVENIFKKFLKTLPLPTDKKIEKDDDIYEIIPKIKNFYPEREKDFIEIVYHIDGKEYNTNDKSENFPILEKGLGKKNNKNGTSTYKTDVSMTFTKICQDFLHFSQKHKSYTAKYYVRDLLIGYYLGIPMFKHKIDIEIIKNDLIEHELNKKENINAEIKIDDLKNGDEKAEEIKYNMAKEYRHNSTLLKKYQFAFSGEDTSVIEVKNKQEMLYYLPAISYEQQLNKKLSNEMYNQKNKIYLLSDFENIVLDMDKDTYLEDVYNFNRDLYDDFDNNFITGIVKMNDINNVQQLKNSNNQEPENDDQIIDARLLYKRYFSSGSMSTIKMDIYGDPYWLAMNALNIGVNTKNDNLNLLPDDLMIRNNFRFIFILKTCPQQSNGLEEYDYIIEDSIYVSGIYLATECESVFENGKFTQSLSGVLDVSLIKDTIVEP